MAFMWVVSAGGASVRAVVMILSTAWERRAVVRSFRGLAPSSG
jgi:hypothetical protein